MCMGGWVGAHTRVMNEQTRGGVGRVAGQNGISGRVIEVEAVARLTLRGICVVLMGRRDKAAAGNACTRRVERARAGGSVHPRRVEPTWGRSGRAAGRAGGQTRAMLGVRVRVGACTRVVLNRRGAGRGER